MGRVEAGELGLAMGAIEGKSIALRYGLGVGNDLRMQFFLGTKSLIVTGLVLGEHISLDIIKRSTKWRFSEVLC